MESHAQENAGVQALACKLKTKIVSITNSYIQLGKDDPRRVLHSLKVALAITVVSFIYYSDELFNQFKFNGIWAVMTVVVVSEFTAGGTLSKVLNRGFATFLGGALAFGAHEFGKYIVGKHVGPRFRSRAELIFVGLCVFILVAGATFTRFFPRIKARYDYGCMIFIMTVSLVGVAGPREGDFGVAIERLETVLMGGAACAIISVFIFPVWAGEELHNSTVSNLEKLAKYLEGFGDVYFGPRYNGKAGKRKENMSLPLEYKSVLNSKAKEEALLPSPEQPRKRIRKLPCSEFQAKIKESCRRMSAQSGNALRELAIAIKTMTEPYSSTETSLNASKSAIRSLKTALKGLSFDAPDLLAILPAATVASVLVEVVKCVEKISTSVHELSNLAHFKTLEPLAKELKPVFPINSVPNDDIDLDKIIVIKLVPHPMHNEPIPNGHV
ncbi:hypothetical protein SLEP1_g38656 [Rubroshorea leprosula]|uniref:Aluminum-activated malate transporter n=1 Tax=Rubroshorea leprosula TaxID=152421 RepID=A0AAV5KYS0_9ROSI|nr:hypothetical protein SLEP1_g38656 [Rubroshorea leprosula]